MTRILLFSTLQNKKLFFDEFDNLLGEFSDEDVLALVAESIAPAQSVDCRDDLAIRIEIAQEVQRIDWDAPKADVSALLDQDVMK